MGNRSTGDTEMGEDGHPIKNEEGGDENTNKEGGKPAAETMCRFNKLCKNPECGFAHSGPVTFTGIVVDTTSECQHGAACSDEKCEFWHNPVMCKYPQCTNKACPFK